SEAPIQTIPLFVREGSILPRTYPAQSTAELTDALLIDVYTGKDGEFVLYEDAGDGYGYENGEYRTFPLRWREKEQKFCMEDEEIRKGREITVNLIGRERNRV
ncbi:MAG: DUF5110 domain-containing protein, partial [Lachnospiraceae bacterium]